MANSTWGHVSQTSQQSENSLAHALTGLRVCPLPSTSIHKQVSACGRLTEHQKPLKREAWAAYGLSGNSLVTDKRMESGTGYRARQVRACQLIAGWPAFASMTAGHSAAGGFQGLLHVTIAVGPASCSCG